jgi:hypothetical protein
MTTLRRAPGALIAMAPGVRAAFAVATIIAAFAAVPLAASTISISYTGTGDFTYITAPGDAASQDSLSANITDAIFGSGTLSVTGDVTDYATGTGSSGADSAVFSFAAGTFSGSSASLLNFATGAETVTYTITDGTGAFAGYTGTVTEDAQFTSFGSFSPNVPATISITSASGTLVTSESSAVPEPSTFVTVLLCAALVVGIRRKYRAV